MRVFISLKSYLLPLSSAKHACPWPTFAASSPSHLYSCGTRRGSTALHGTRLRPPPWGAAAVVGRGNCPGGRQRGPRAAQCQRHGDPKARDASQALWICVPGEWDAGGEPKKEMMMGKMESNFCSFFFKHCKFSGGLVSSFNLCHFHHWWSMDEWFWDVLGALPWCHITSPLQKSSLSKWALLYSYSSKSLAAHNDKVIGENNLSNGKRWSKPNTTTRRWHASSCAAEKCQLWLLDPGVSLCFFATRPEVLLASDPNCDRAATALCVGVGRLHEPKEWGKFVATKMDF